MITGVYYRGQFLMTNRGPAPTNAEVAVETTTPEEQPQADRPEEPTADEPGESETPAAQRRARLRKEIRAGMQRAIKH